MGRHGSTSSSRNRGRSWEAVGVAVTLLAASLAISTSVAHAVPRTSIAPFDVSGVPVRSCGLASSQQAGRIYASRAVSCSLAHRLDAPARACAFSANTQCFVMGFRCTAHTKLPEGSVTRCVRARNEVVVISIG